MQKIKILHIITRLIRGGAQEVVLSMIDNLDKARYTPFLATGIETGPEGDLWDEAKEKGVEPIFIPQLIRRISPINDLISLIKIYRFIKKERFDVVHTHTSKAGILGRIASKLAGVPIIIHSPHGHIFHPDSHIDGVPTNRFLLKLLLCLERFTAKFTDRIIALTEFGKRDQVRLGIGETGKYVVIHNMIDLERYQFGNQQNLDEKKRELGLFSTSPIVGTVARLTPEKGHRYLLEAVAKIKPSIPDIKFLLIGDGPLRDELENQADKMAISDNVIFLGLHKDVPEILQILDLFVLPSLYEGLGIVLVEAMACGKPVVATSVGGVPEIVKDGQTGLLVPPHDSSALARAIKTLLDDTKRAEEMGMAGKEKVGQMFDQKIIIKKYTDVYDSMMREKLGYKKGERRFALH